MPESPRQPRANRLAVAQKAVAGVANESVYPDARELAISREWPRKRRFMTRHELAAATLTKDEAATDEELRGYYEQLRAMRVTTLQDTFFELHGRATRTNNHAWLVKRIFFRVQELRLRGGLSPAAAARLEELSGGTSVNVRPVDEEALPPQPVEAGPRRDPRLPPAGTVVEREHEGVRHAILILEEGFEYQGRFYGSLSTIAREITGTSWNGFLWAGLSKRKSSKAGGAP